MDKPPPLFHYTDQAGLLGILESRTIWATDIRYLNDSTELTHALDAATGLLVSKAETLDDEDPGVRLPGLGILQKAIEALRHRFRLLGGTHVVSFSTQDDLLSQWRAYGGAAGYAIGFEIDVVQPRQVPPEIQLGPCQYGTSELLARLDHWVKSLSSAGAAATPSAFGDLFQTVVGQHAPFVKHPTFDEEDEWRLVVWNPFVEVHRLHAGVRRGVSTPIPYCEVPLQGPAGGLRISEIVVVQLRSPSCPSRRSTPL